MARHTAKSHKIRKVEILVIQMGIGMSIIAILVLTMGLFENILPAFFVYIALGIILVDVVVIIILGNTLCRK